jgi:glycerol-3-phosphate O-acyltransferase
MAELTAIHEKTSAPPVELDYQDTAGMVNTLFAWRPGCLTRLLARLLSRLMKPLEHGSYHGKELEGEPNRPSSVIAGRLTVFALRRARFSSRLILSARLRHSGDINIVRIAAERGKAQRREMPRGRRVKLEKTLGEMGLATISDFEPDGGDPLEALIALQRQSTSHLTLVPLARTSHQVTRHAPPVSLYTRAYRFLPYSVFRRASSRLRTLRTGSLKNGSPILLTRWLDTRRPSEDISEAARGLRVRLTDAMEAEHRASEGPPLEPVAEVKRRVLADPVLNSYMKEHGLEQGMPQEEVTVEARGYLDEIAADYRSGVVRWFARFVDFVFGRFLEGLEVDRAGIRYISECDTRKRLVLVCSHKSYVDPLLVGYALYRSGLVPPHQAAGLNLSFWPVGWLLRHSGAFYLRRSFRGETLYREVFSAYVRYLVAENYITVLYIEGTRSRDGKLAAPKTGFLGILAEALKMGVCRDIELLPVYLGYDKVPEESAHVREMSGSKKIAESVRLFVRIYNSVNTRLGKAYVKFGKPVSLGRALENAGLEEVAGLACGEINRITPLTARSVAAMSLLSDGGEWVSSEEVSRAATVLLEHATRRGTKDVPGTGEVMEAVRWFESEGRVRRESRGGVEGYLVRGEARRHLLYNANICCGHFWEESLSALAQRSDGEVSRVGAESFEDRFDTLRRLLEHESPVGCDAGRRCMDSLLDDAAKTSGGDKRRLARIRVLASIARPALEAYHVALRALERFDCGELLDREAFIEACFTEGEKMLADNRLTGVESLSRVSFKNAARAFLETGLLAESPVAAEDGSPRMVLARTATGEEVVPLEGRLRPYTRKEPRVSG